MNHWEASRNCWFGAEFLPSFPLAALDILHRSLQLIIWFIKSQGCPECGLWKGEVAFLTIGTRGLSQCQSLSSGLESHRANTEQTGSAPGLCCKRWTKPQQRPAWAIRNSRMMMTPAPAFVAALSALCVTYRCQGNLVLSGALHVQCLLQVCLGPGLHAVPCPDVDVSLVPPVPMPRTPCAWCPVHPSPFSGLCLLCLGVLLCAVPSVPCVP